MAKKKRRTRLKDLSPRDRAEIQRFKKFLRLTGKGMPEKTAYELLYGEIVFEAIP